MKKLAKDLVLVKPLSSGGMGEVFLAKKIGANGFQKDIAVKRILPGMINAQSQQAFFIEAKVLANIHHPNVVQVYGFGEAENCFYLEMEYIHGMSLRSILNYHRQHGLTLPIPVVAYVLAEAANGLSAAHQYFNTETKSIMPVIHRDISPDNIMLSYNGDVKIIDFGVIKVENMDLTQTDSIKGKCSYMSPEQATGEKLDPRTDVFSLGIVAWEMFMNDRLFAAETDYKTLNNVVSKPIPFPSAGKNPIPAELAQVAMRALERTLDKRLKSANEFTDEIHKWMHANSVRFTRSDLNKYLTEHFSDTIRKASEEATQSEKSVRTMIDKQLKEDSLAPEVRSATITRSTATNVIEIEALNRRLARTTQEIHSLRAKTESKSVGWMIFNFVIFAIVLGFLYLVIIFFPFASLDVGGDGIKINYEDMGNVRDFCPNYAGSSRLECLIEYVTGR